MSQDLRDYDLTRVDKRPNEARRLSVTATVGPRSDDNGTRGVQLTLSAGVGTTYGRLSEPQVRDLIETLQRRLDPGDGFEATSWDAERQTVEPDGTTTEEE